MSRNIKMQPITEEEANSIDVSKFAPTKTDEFWMFAVGVVLLFPIYLICLVRDCIDRFRSRRGMR